MSLFDKLATDDSIQTEEDRLGGLVLLDSGVYPAKIKLAYVTESSGGAMCLNVNFDVDGKEVRQQFYMTSGKAKGQKNYYETKDGEKKFLPGFNMGNALCLLTLGKEITSVGTENKVIGLYNFDAKKEVPTEVPVITDLIGQEIELGLLRQTVDKVKKDSNGAYQKTGETREENEVDKLFRASDHLTTAEIRGGVTEPKFHKAWVDKWTGVTRDKSSGGGKGGNNTSSSAGGTSGTGGGGKPTESLFG